VLIWLLLLSGVGIAEKIRRSKVQKKGPIPERVKGQENKHAQEKWTKPGQRALTYEHNPQQTKKSEEEGRDKNGSETMVEWTSQTTVGR